MRQMATIRKIEEVRTIPDADRIVAYRVGGWWVVDTVGKYTVGDLVVYAEPDSWIPTELAPFLSKGKEPREFNGVKGEKLRTIRLRKQLSQGLLLPLEPTCSMIDSMLFEGLDVSYPLGIEKYEAPVPACLAGLVRGNFPSWIPKTDQERIQNLSKEIEQWQCQNLTWEVTEKLEGTSMTVYLRDGDFGVCSRNLDLKRDENNTLWAIAIRNQLEEKLSKVYKNIALQGELVGEGIQGNIYKIKGQEFYLFDVYDIDNGRYFTPTERNVLCDVLDIKHVPMWHPTISIGYLALDQILEQADGQSAIGPNGCKREGLVYKCNELPASFKTVSNAYLLKSGE